MRHFCSLLFLLTKLCALNGFICPGGKGECASGMTCCELPNGSQGCCPFQDASCCKDKIHCCPKGFRCNKNGCSQVREVSSAPLTLIGILNNVICPDNHQCPDGQTCCPFSSNNYGCCPMANAVCCQDKQHCCPSGTFCDNSGYCYQGETSLGNYSSSIVCPGGRFICPTGNTCCAIGENWGCCPLENAVCCSDQVHCCPEGYTCYGTGCVESKKQILFHKFKKIKKFDASPLNSIFY